MKKDDILVILFVILVLLNGAIFILLNVITGDTKKIEIVLVILMFVIGIGTYVYWKKISY